MLLDWAFRFQGYRISEARRWVVDRSFARAARRLARDYKNLAVTLGPFHFLAFACLMIASHIPFAHSEKSFPNSRLFRTIGSVNLLPLTHRQAGSGPIRRIHGHGLNLETSWCRLKNLFQKERVGNAWLATEQVAHFFFSGFNVNDLVVMFL
jgi:hypothetical protein